MPPADTRAAILAAAQALLTAHGQAGFTTRAVCAAAGVTAPTLYHHFGNTDGLLSELLAAAFAEFLARKHATEAATPDPVAGLTAGWNDYVAFAAARPNLYAAMIARLLQGGTIQAAAEARRLLLARLHAVAALGRLAIPAEHAADLLWASAHAAAMLHVTGAGPAATGPPAPETIAALRHGALAAILRP